MVIGALVYANALDGPFVFDDTQNVRDNANIHIDSIGLDSLLRITAESRKRPVAMLSFALNHRVGGLEVRGYHLVNVALHLVTALIVYALTAALLARDPTVRERTRMPAALLAGCVFVAHPLQTQAVTYLVQRMACLAALFYLAALLLYVRGRGAGRRVAWWSGAALCWLLALGSKEIAITLPAVVLLYEWIFERDAAVPRGAAVLAGVAVAATGVGALALWSAGTLDYSHRDFTMWQRVLTELRVVVSYVGLAVAPLPSSQSLIHDVPLSRSLLDPPTTLLAALAIAAAVGGAIAAARRQRVLAFGVLFFFANLVLESSILPLELMYEHRLYLPLFGIALVCGRVGAAAGARWPVRTTLVATAVVVVLSAATVARNAVWNDEVRLWSDTFAKSPGSARTANNLGSALERAGRFEEALAPLREAVALEPDYARGHNNLGIVLHRLERLDEAIAQYREAVRLSPRYADAHRNLGSALAGVGRHEEAIAAYREAVRLDPDDADAQFGLAYSYAKLGRLDAAVAALEATLRADPRHAEASAILRSLKSRVPDPPAN